MPKYRPLKELLLARTREFLREPEAVFWVYGFPILLMIGLGVAFRSGGTEEVRVDVAKRGQDEIQARAVDAAAEVLRKSGGFKVEVRTEEEARAHYRQGKTDLVLFADEQELRYVFDPARKESELARFKVDAALRPPGRGAEGAPMWRAVDDPVSEPGSRYIDWLIPGLLGMGLMSGGLWGLGYVTVEFRMKKLLKRFVATPMRRSDFLIAMVTSRLMLLVPETMVLLAVGALLFGFRVQGSIAGVLLAILMGAMCFAGLGLLVACRTAKIEVISGLMNLVMLPMWILSGNFFSSARFPDVMQPFIQALPLTQLNNLLRALMLEGAPLASQLLPLGVLAAYAVVAFVAALRWFRWI